MSDYIEDLSIISKQAVHQESDSDSDLFELSSVGSACTHLADSLNDDEEASREPLRKKIKKEEDPELWRAQYRPCLLTQEEYDLYSTDEDTVVPSTIPKVYYSPISFGGNGNCWGTSPKNCTKKNTVQKSEFILQEAQRPLTTQLQYQSLPGNYSTVVIRRYSQKKVQVDIYLYLSGTVATSNQFSAQAY
jgi:hypothetical protein